jgi:nicotinate-nucleotide adenylyltransferase
MNITLFGGSFNPPHLGHLIVIHQASELIPDMDQLWVLPAYRHTFQKNLAPAQHRLEMCQRLVDEANKFSSGVKLSRLEVDNKLSGETYEAVRLLKKESPKHSFSFLMGSDQLKSFKKWGNWTKLLEQMPFFVYPRAGYKNRIGFPNMTLLHSATQVVTNISSTLIRERIKKALPISHLLPDQVLKYSRIHKLY